MATVASLFDTREQAEAAIAQLRNNGITPDRIGIAIKDKAELRTAVEHTGVDASTAAATGAVAGGLLGGGLGLLLTAVGAFAIPVIGPIVAAGPLAAALTGAGVGAATGGLLGALTAAGIPEEEAHVYQSGVERGGVLVTVEAPAGQENMVRSVMQQYGSVNPDRARDTFAANPDYRFGRDERLGTNNTGSGSEAVAGGASAVAGGVIGGVVGGPLGAVAGAAIGGAAGAGAAHVAENDEGSSAGPQAGGATGAVVGGALGSIGGPLGAAAGAAIGAATGGAIGDKATHAAAEADHGNLAAGEVPVIDATGQPLNYNNLPDQGYRAENNLTARPTGQYVDNQMVDRTNPNYDPTTGERLDQGTNKSSGAGEAVAGGASAVVGGVIGGVVGGPLGAVAGAAIGGAAGAGGAHVAENDKGSSVGPQAGGATGAVVGGVIGSVGGPVGTAIGAALGGAAGGLTGEKATEAGADAEEEIKDDRTVSGETYRRTNLDTTDRSGNL